MSSNLFKAVITGALLAALPAFAEIVDPDNNVLPDSADMGDIDQSKTKISDLKTRIAPGYATLTNDVKGLTTTVAGKQDKLPYATNAIPQGAVSGLTLLVEELETQVSGKQDKLPYPTNAVPWNAVSGKPNFATVATSGSYNDLSDKPAIPTVPTNVSAFENDAGYVTETVTNGLLSASTASSTYATKEENAAKQDALPYPTNAIPQGAVSGLSTALDGKVSQTDFNSVSNAAMTVYEGVTNRVLAGYGYPFTPWTNDKPELGLTAPVYIGFKNGSLVVYQWKYEATNDVGTVIGGPYLIPATADGADALQLSTTLNTTNIVFSRTGTPIYTNALNLATMDNLKPYVKHTELDTALTDYVSNETLENYDASYKIVEGICDENQTIQVVVSESTTPSPLEIQLPTNGRCKDWIVYVVAATNMPLVLPPADYWVRNESVTNAVAAGTPTALYFSQVSTNSVFTIGRQEYIPITVTSARGGESIREKMMRIALSAKSKPTSTALRSFNRPVAKPASTSIATKAAAKPTTTAVKTATPAAKTTTTNVTATATKK